MKGFRVGALERMLTEELCRDKVDNAKVQEIEKRILEKEKKKVS